MIARFKSFSRYCVFAALAGFTLDTLATQIEVLALFKGAVLLKIDGREHLLKSGKKSPEGVILVSATTKEATIEVGGQRKTLGLSQSISSAYQQPAFVEFTIPMNARGQYMTMATINGRMLDVQVDTGANIIALSRIHADQLGINYRRGEKSKAATASGVVDSWLVTLDSVTVGGITVPKVQASVIDAEYPLKVLLGMTFLDHVELHKQGDSLLLKQRY